ncbi:MAG TPA: PPOX class F420-dependent oxidoreductase [Jiangellaceae bacterium]|nr:PPOX class F420-dependent oxidoreductase [Jiangellaceae bacterium]
MTWSRLRHPWAATCASATRSTPVPHEKSCCCRATTPAEETSNSVRRFGTLATIKRDGHPQQSTILYGFESESGVVRISVTDTRAKTKNIQRDPRVSLHVRGPNVWSWVVAEGTAQLTAVWQEYRDAQVSEQRRVLRLPIERVYGQA